jgi:hypothetical protein
MILNEMVVKFHAITNAVMKFIELKVSEDAESKTQLVNVQNIGRVYANPQSSRKCIVELNYQSINDAPVYLEVEMPYETVRSYLVS